MLWNSTCREEINRYQCKQEDSFHHLNSMWRHCYKNNIELIAYMIKSWMINILIRTRKKVITKLPMLVLGQLKISRELHWIIKLRKDLKKRLLKSFSKQLHHEPLFYRMKISNISRILWPLILSEAPKLLWIIQRKRFIISLKSMSKRFKANYKRLLKGISYQIVRKTTG